MCLQYLNGLSSVTQVVSCQSVSFKIMFLLSVNVSKNVGPFRSASNDFVYIDEMFVSLLVLCFSFSIKCLSVPFFLQGGSIWLFTDVYSCYYVPTCTFRNHFLCLCLLSGEILFPPDVSNNQRFVSLLLSYLCCLLVIVS